MITQTWLTLHSTGTRRQRREWGGWVARFRASSCCGAFCLTTHLPSHVGRAPRWLLSALPLCFSKSLLYPTTFFLLYMTQCSSMWFSAVAKLTGQGLTALCLCRSCSSGLSLPGEYSEPLSEGKLGLRQYAALQKMFTLLAESSCA